MFCVSHLVLLAFTTIYGVFGDFHNSTYYLNGKTKCQDGGPSSDKFLGVRFCVVSTTMKKGLEVVLFSQCLENNDGSNNFHFTQPFRRSHNVLEGVHTHYLIAHVRKRNWKEDNHEYYSSARTGRFARPYTEWDIQLTANPKNGIPYHEHPVYLDSITLEVDGFKIHSDVGCDIPERWLAQHGIYLLINDVWQTMYYDPSLLPAGEPFPQ